MVGAASLALFLLLLLPSTATGGDWPTYNADSTRSGITRESISVPLQPIWTHRLLQAPAPAWPDPARDDFWHEKHDLEPRIVYDRACHVVAAGDLVCFGSSADDHLYALDGKTGRIRWTYAAAGPIRLAPTLYREKVLFGADDGLIRCLDGATGKLLWERRVGAGPDLVPGNGRLISRWPIRTGLVVREGTAYCGAGLFPQTEGAYLAAFDAVTGRGLWHRKVDQSLQGYMLASSERLFVPSGRTVPHVFARADGRPEGAIDDEGLDAGGGYGIIDEKVLVSGPGDGNQGRLVVTDRQTRTRIVTFSGLRLIPRDGRYYIQGRTTLTAIDRRHLTLARARNAAAARRKKIEKKKDDRSRRERERLDRRIADLEREMKRCRLWERPCSCPFALILAGETFFAGGAGKVEAYDLGDGRLVWSHPVAGRAYGLAAAAGRLYVSTSLGEIHCFRAVPSGGDQEPSPPPPRIRPTPPGPTGPARGLRGAWYFHPDKTRGKEVADLAGRNPAISRDEPCFLDREGIPGLDLDLTGPLTIAGGDRSTALPRESFTVAAWVRLGQVTDWGGIVGAVQDNGSYEKGWILGYRGSRFCLAVSSRGKKRLTYLVAPAPFDLHRWYHLAGTYDGERMALYVDGRIVAESTAQSGPIDYAPRFPFTVGAFHDDTECHPMAGDIHELRIFHTALSPGRIADEHARKASLFPPPPLYATFPAADLAPTAAVLHWRSSRPEPGEIRFGAAPGRLDRRVPVQAAGRDRRAELTGLVPDRIYSYRWHLPGKPDRTGPLLSFRTPPALAARPAPFGTDPAVRRRAGAILAGAGLDRGHCLVLDADRGRLAYELARSSRLQVTLLIRDRATAAAVREDFRKSGIYGRRLTVHMPAGPGLPYPPYMFNLVVWSDGQGDSGALAPPERILDLLAPTRGVFHLTGGAGDGPEKRTPWLAAAARLGFIREEGAGEGGPLLIRRPALAGAGSWTHGLADPANTACSGDRLVAGPLRLQWFGRPGPRRMIDRHHRNVPPLYRDGRLYIPGDRIVYAVDAYNGTILWRREFPRSRRLGVFLDSSNLAVDGDHLHLAAHDRCHLLHVATGETVRSLALPKPRGWEDRVWGYLALAGGLVVGSGCKPGAAYREQSRQADSLLWYDRMALVTSDYLFALARSGGRRRWLHRDGVILNTTIAIGRDRVFFISSNSPKALSNTVGRMPMKDFLAGPNHLTALDLESGRPVYRRSLDLADFQHIAYINYAAGKLILSGNRYIDGRLWYFFTGFDAATGRTVWKSSHNSGYKPGGGHGEQNRHPTVVGDTLYTYPLAYDLHTGKPRPGWRFSRRGHGCGNISASAHSLFWRGGNPQMWDLRPGGGPAPVNRVSRPGCFINMIPAGGLLMIPEASSGCTCGFPLQTSLCYVPAAKIR